MMTERPSYLAGLAAAGLLLVSFCALRAQPPKEEDPLRKQALALNSVTGDDPMKGEIRTLSEKPAEAKKLLAAAVQMTKQKDQPFNYNGAFILATVAYRLQDWDTSELFFLLCADQAAKIQSVHKMGQAATGITGVIEELYLDKKYDRSAKLSQRFLETLERWGAEREFKELVMRHMVQAMFKQGEADKAVRMVDNLIKTQPNDWRNLKLKAWMEQEKGRQDESIKMYMDVLGRISQDPGLQTADKADEQNKVAISVLLLIEQHYFDKNYEKSQKLSQELLETLEKQGVSRQLKDMVKRQMIQSIVRRGQIDQAKPMLEGLLKQGSDDWRNLKLKAWFASEAGRFDESAKAYEEVFQKVTQDAGLEPDERTEEQRRIRYILSGVYVDLNRVDKAANELKALLAQEPDNSTFNNDLGYIWADHDTNLDEAERMIRKALDEDRKQRKENKSIKPEEDKDNPAYLDSMGWVLFKKKNFQEAKKYLLRASQDKDGQHIEILDHLADTHIQLGEKADAVAVWKKALEIKPATKREEQKKTTIEQKLKGNK